MQRYVDGFVIPLAKDKVGEYADVAHKAGEIWKEHGALDYYECVGDDLDVKDLVSFKQAAGTRENETVIFSWIVYESKEHRDKVNAAVMSDPRLNEMIDGGFIPFDSRRMVYGGFKTLVVL